MIIIITAVILVSMLLVSYRLVKGPTVSDRILAANTFGTKTVILIAIMSYIAKDTMLLDISLIYALINFITTTALLKYFQHNSLGKR